MDLQQLRYFLKDEIRDLCDYRHSPQQSGCPAPPEVKPVQPGQKTIAFPPLIPDILHHNDLFEAICSRRSRRKYAQDSLSLAELGWLCYAVQGMPPSPMAHNRRRNVPSAGNRHSFETYLAVLHVEGLAPGIYRYLPPEHALVLEREAEDLADRLGEVCRGQSFAGMGAVTFLFTTLPYRAEWRYMEAAAKTIALDAGHVMQNLYLAAEAIDCGVCAIAAYLQKETDALLGVDGEDEFTLYLAPVGRIPER